MSVIYYCTSVNLIVTAYLMPKSPWHLDSGWSSFFCVFSVCLFSKIMQILLTNIGLNSIALWDELPQFSEKVNLEKKVVQFSHIEFFIKFNQLVILQTTKCVQSKSDIPTLNIWLNSISFSDGISSIHVLWKKNFINFVVDCHFEIGQKVKLKQN